MGKHRILILSLGTGSGLKDKNMYPSDTIFHSSGASVYRQTTYQFDGSEEKVQSAFVAEPLIRRCDPEYVIVIGSIRSSWSNFYRNFAGENKDYEIYKRLYDLETQNDGKNTLLDKLEEYRQQIEMVYDRLLFPDRKVKVILMQ